MSHFGNWASPSTGKYGHIISDQPTGIDDPSNKEACGGSLVCESTGHLCHPLLLNASRLFDLLEQILRKGNLPEPLRQKALDLWCEIIEEQTKKMK